MKKWFQSKTIWSDILTIAIALYGAVHLVLQGHGINIPAPDGPMVITLLTVLGGLGIYGRKAANGPIVK